ncbi:MAG: hypothetical protein EXS58_00860 [Candidatus Latescibacteria bacterium]|nr:hypothetical protein [Candidatus Latescibacterota bacterium]
MKAYEFPEKITADGQLDIPAGFSDQLPREKEVRVLLLVPETDQDPSAWAQLTAEQFLAGYSDADVVYDRLP